MEMFARTPGRRAVDALVRRVGMHRYYIRVWLVVVRACLCSVSIRLLFRGFVHHDPLPDVSVATDVYLSTILENT